MMKFIANFFRAWQRAQRPTWEFRIRFSTELNGWVIEKCELNNEQWITLHERMAQKPYAQIPLFFETFEEAQNYAVSSGLANAYEQVHYTTPAPKRTLSPNERALVNRDLDRALEVATGLSPSLTTGRARPALQPVARH